MSRQLLFAALMICLVIALSESRAANSYFWLSGSSNPAMSGLPSSVANVPIIANSSNGTGSIYIWGKAASGKTLRNFSLNLKAETTNSVVFTGSEIYNDPPNLSQDHWEEIVEPVGVSNSILNIVGYSLGSGYLGIGEGATASSYYDAASQSWLVAKVDYSIPTTPLNFAPAKLFLEIGSFGMNYSGEPTSTASIVFGAANDIAFNAGPALGGRNSHAGSDWDATLPYLNADFTETGSVGATDLPLWQTGYGVLSGAVHSQGDANGDRAVNGRDFLIWQRQYGMSVVSGLAASVSIPEPNSLTLTATTIYAILATRRQRRHVDGKMRMMRPFSSIRSGSPDVHERGEI